MRALSVSFWMSIGSNAEKSSALESACQALTDDTVYMASRGFGKVATFSDSSHREMASFVGLVLDEYLRRPTAQSSFRGEAHDTQMR
jgi:hypothetical protein